MNMKRIIKSSLNRLKRIQQIHSVPPAYYFSNLIFIHIPKNGGTSVMNNLFGFVLPHVPLHVYYRSDKNFTAQAFKLAISRHPYSRFISAFNYIKSGGNNPRDQFVNSDFLSLFDTPNHLAEDFEALKLISKKIIHFMPQYKFTSYYKGDNFRCDLNLCIPLECLDDNIDYLKDLVPFSLKSRQKRILPSQKSPQHQEVNSDSLSPLACENLNHIYDFDFVIFSYHRSHC